MSVVWKCTQKHGDIIHAEEKLCSHISPEKKKNKTLVILVPTKEHLNILG